MNPGRRRWMVGAGAGAGALVLGGGAGTLWWRSRESAEPSSDNLEAAFWRAEFPAPDGRMLSMASFRGRPLLVNFWATWCPPCVQELPLLNRFYRQHGLGGWQVLGLAVDQADPVRRFLQRMPLDFPVGVCGFAGSELSRGLGNLSAGLPFSVVWGPDGHIRHRKLGMLGGEELEQWAQLG